MSVGNSLALSPAGLFHQFDENAHPVSRVARDSPEWNADYTDMWIPEVKRVYGYLSGEDAGCAWFETSLGSVHNHQKW